jgi:hypothetical protein
MLIRTLHEWAVVWVAGRGIAAGVVERDARQHLKDRGELDGIPRGEIDMRHLTESVALRLLDGLEVSRQQRAHGGG